MLKEFADFIAERDAALRVMDLAWAKKRKPQMSDEVALIAMHKARVEVTSMPEKLRRTSMAWLMMHGYKRLGGLPWPKDGSLPE